MKDHYTEIFLKSAGEEYNTEKIISLRSIWWYNLRGKSKGGLRLTEQGIDYIENQSEIKTYQVDFPKEIAITPQILIWLDQYIESPYFLTKKFIKVLSEKAAFELYLFSGDVKKYGLSKTLHQRLTQDLEHV
jgi:hypothetical protein